MRTASNVRLSHLFTFIATLTLLAAPSSAQQMVMKTEHFNTDPGWDGHNNRTNLPPVQILQSFGYTTSSNAGGPAGEVGGLITPAGEPAYYAKAISLKSFSDTLFASGTLKIPARGHTLLGFFNSNTINEWRTPNTISLRLYGRDGYFQAYADYGTSKWRAGGTELPGTFASSPIYNWSLAYDPNANGGGGAVTATVGSQSIVTKLESGHKLDGATFDRFGFLNVIKSVDDRGSMWIDNLNLNGVTETFTTNPGWVGFNNNSFYSSNNVRPRFDFGYSGGTSYAGGGSTGEIGGATFRGNSGAESLMAYYGGKLDQTLTTEQPLHASGKVAFRRGVSDSTTLIGFFHSTDSVRVSSSQASHVPENFIGAAIEGPSADGFYFYPSYGTDEEGISSRDRGLDPPHIYPDSTSHDWALDYDPTADGGVGRITISLDGLSTTLDLTAAHRAIGGHFDRFGIITTHVDGNGQTVYFDDLTYTVGIPEPSAAVVCVLAGWLALRRQRHR